MRRGSCCQDLAQKCGRAQRVFSVADLMIFAGALALMATQASAGRAAQWEIKGEMSEACTCEVPCGCNFASGPSPHHYCWSLASFDIQTGHYRNTKLGGLHLVRAHGGKAVVWYIDEQATPQQEQALRAIASRVSQSWRPFPVRFAKARITQTFRNRAFRIRIMGKGGFDADELIGGDGKNPIVVENMTAWNVQHDIKGRTKWLRYSDQFGDHFDLTGTNANLGQFDWTDKTSRYF
ncbi:MAG: DUF1326 domain-containing protein [Terriglobia bacterium]